MANLPPVATAGDVPVNYQKRDLNELERDVDYVFQMLDSYQQIMQQCGVVAQGCRFVELGPGSNFGAQLILASMGSQVTLADRFLARWDDDYHPALYRAITARWNGPKSELEAVINGASHSASSLLLLEEPAEALASIPDASVDLIYSNAVLEHIVDPARVAEETARILKPGGWAAHQIDWRYHGDFSRPLEHLIMDDRKFFLAARMSNNEFGNRFRPAEFAAHFEGAGLEIASLSVNLRTSPDYLRDAVPRLRASRTPYRFWPEHDLEPLSGLFLLQKQGDKRAEPVKGRGRATAALIDALKAASLAVPRDQSGDASLCQLSLDPASMIVRRDHLWTVELPTLRPGDSLDDLNLSPLELLEDGEYLGPPHQTHDSIAAIGDGRYAHWGTTLYFSTSDNTSPRRNGRRYEVRVPTAWAEQAAGSAPSPGSILRRGLQVVRESTSARVRIMVERLRARVGR